MLFTEESRDRILAEYEITLSEIDFEISDDMTEEEFRAAVEAFKCKTDDDDDEKKKHSSKSYSATYNQKREAIQNALDPVIIKDGNGDIQSEMYYWLMDFDDSYAYVERSIFTADDYQRDNGRFSYVMSEDGLSATVSGEFELMILKWLTVQESEELEASREEFESLVAFKNERLKADHELAVDNVLADFSDLNDNEEFSALTEISEDGTKKAYSYQNLEELSNICFAIRGKTVHVKGEPPTQKTAKQFLDGQLPDANEKYGNLFVKYGRQKS